MAKRDQVSAPRLRSLSDSMDIYSFILTPIQFVENPMHLRDYLQRYCCDLQLSAADAHRIIDALPLALRAAPCFKNRLTGQHCYEYGALFYLPDGTVLFGSPQVLRIDDLIRAIQAFHHYLPPSEWGGIVKRLEDFDRHFEAIAEMHPLMLVRGIQKAEHEVQGTEKRTVDWRFEWENSTTILLEVKSRIYSLIETLPNINPSDSSSLAPRTEPERLFRSIAEKFPVRDPDSTLQGAWLQVLVRQKKNAVDNYFAQVDQERLHFAILWSGDTSQLQAYVVHRADVDGRALLDKFGLQYSEELLF